MKNAFGVLARINQEEQLTLLVERFAGALLAKLKAAEKKYDWQGAWMDPDRITDMQQDFMDHVEKGDPIDVAAYAAFLWYHGASTNEERI